MNILSFTVNTLNTTVVYALFALAVVFAYRTSRILFFCAGEIGTMSAYILADVWDMTHHSGGGLALAVLATLLFDVLTGSALFLVLREEKQEDPFTGTAITIALSILFIGAMSVTWGSLVKQLPLVTGAVSWQGTTVQIVSLVTICLGAAAITGILSFFYMTRIGVELQALANNRRLAVLCGISINASMLLVWTSCCVMSGFAGVLSGAVSSISVEGSAVGFSGIVAAIIGGLTSPGGALIGALLLAIGENLISLFFDVRYNVVIPVAMLTILLIVRPWGISANVERITRT